MTTLVQISQIETLPGQQTVLHEVDWHQFETILADLGERRISRIAYLNGTLEIEMPLPEHERIKVFIADLIKNLLDELQIDFEAFGSTTFKNQAKLAGLEPDDCFYIQHHELMRSTRGMNFAIDPPPDLAIEVDVTSKTKFEVYEALAVPELWIYLDNTLHIYVLRDGKYLEVQFSPTFGNLPVREVFPRFVEQSFREGRSAAMRAFRAWLQARIDPGTSA